MKQKFPHEDNEQHCLAVHVTATQFEKRTNPRWIPHADAGEQ